MCSSETAVTGMSCTSSTASSSNMAQSNNINNNKNNNRILSVHDFLWHVKFFLVMIKPMESMMTNIFDIVRWKSWVVSSSVLLVANMTALLATRGDIFFLLFLGMSALALLGFINFKTGIFKKYLPDTSHIQVVDEEKDGEGIRDPILVEFCSVLKKLDDVIIETNAWMEFIFQVLDWTKPKLSLAYYGSAVLFLSATIWLPDCVVGMLVINIVMFTGLGVEMHLRPSCPKVDIMCDKNTGKCNDENLDKEEAGKQDVDAENSSDAQLTDTEKLIEELNEDMEEEAEKLMEAVATDSGDTTLDTSADLVQPADVEQPEEPSVEASGKQTLVRRLVELRQRHRHHAANLGSCTSCSTPFSIIKRRYYCRHCGNHFCSRCCSNKVPRSLFGATAPAAKLETVLVCYICYNILGQKQKEG
ncbi:PREDICTED: protrudin-like [Priapulus caudatus]|uniref:Protrudin n=1 Tax=Priapulus caudatus TaxID=37621 RepID=A0ABM1ENP7_PRICU|nr:PREDICTED: protrudin-like [Priapulus caudatus]